MNKPRSETRRSTALRKYYEGDEYFETLSRLSESPQEGECRQKALIEVLGGCPEGLQILDVGCGLGGFSKCLKEGNVITGIDINPKFLQHVSQRLGYRSIKLDVEQPWGLAGKEFDLVLFGDVLEHLFDPVAALREAVGVLRDDGRVIVSVPNVGYWKKRMRLLFTGEIATDLLDEHVRFFSRRLIAKAFNLAGLEVEKSVSYSWKKQGSWYEKLPFADWVSWGFVVSGTKRERFQ